MPRPIDPERLVVFFDFDNTITTFDILDDMLVRFSGDERWKALERKWQKGEIGSKECLKGQIGGIRITRQALNRYLSGVRIDPYFRKLSALLSYRDIKSFILSDNFGYIVRRILKVNGMTGLKIYANTVRFKGDRLIPGFPFTGGRCDYCAHCKKETLRTRTPRNFMAVYVGDGLSDVYPSKYADIVFAKDSLLEYYKAGRLSCIPYRSLKDVYTFFKALPSGGKKDSG
jgi:2,3-diketo-5-methylthio-1-phosphopentane phosphatase